MQYRKLKGTTLFNGTELLQGYVLVAETNGTIIDVMPYDNASDVEEFEGIICPGFINAHCHLELSQMKGRVPEGTGLVDFLITVVEGRNKEAAKKQIAIKAAAEEMHQNGIAAVADICNTTDTIQVKKQSHMQWHNLVEVINFNDANLENALTSYNEVKKTFTGHGLSAVLTPHAPYSVSAATYEAINRATEDGIISMHNQETPDENTVFLTGGGDFLRLYAKFGNGVSPFPVSGKTSLQTWLPYFTAGQTIILVHNTFTSEEDIVFAKNHADKHGLRLVYCLCPNANMYIEKKLPPVDLFIKNDCFIVIGTDSYSSNYRLSISEEMKTLQLHFPHLTITQLLKWATANGAEALGWEGLGRFKKGLNPGILLINERDFSVQRLI